MAHDNDSGFITVDIENPRSDFYNKWVDLASAKHSNPAIAGANMFRDLYPSHSVVMTQQFNLFGFPHVVVKPFRDVPLITNVQFASLARSVSPRPGRIVDRIEFGAFFVAWSNFDFIVFVIRYAEGFSSFNQYFLLREGDEEPARELLLSAGLWDNEAHQEIWVFNQGMWRKDAALFQSVQQADWKDVILKDEFKEKLQKDVYGFFTSEHIYKELAIPWKRGIMMYGPPGNGKTISLKVFMKECGDQGFTPLYVKSFTSYMGDEAAMEICFNKARQLSPCVLVLEDLDSLITDRNRSFFLNQLDGLQGNDGMLVIGTTNHLSKIDGSLTNRPSRFDRKFLFDNPDLDERMLYAQYWQRKLENNTEIDFPDALLQIIVDLTDKFSFAYLKEAFVSSLVTLAGITGEKPSFKSVILEQIQALRKELSTSLCNERVRAALGNPNSSNMDHVGPPQTPAEGQVSSRRDYAVADEPDSHLWHSLRALVHGRSNSLSERHYIV